jgi:hypothetical protein
MIRITFDMRPFAAGARRFASALPSQLAQGLNKSARLARTAFIKTAAVELGVKRGSVTAGAAADFKRASPGHLVATYTPSTKTGRFGDLGIKFSASRKAGLTAATHVLTKGSKLFKRGFVYKGRAVSRTGKGRYKFKSLKATTPARLMEQGDNPAAETWETTALASLAVTIPDAIEKAAQKAGFQ